LADHLSRRHFVQVASGLGTLGGTRFSAPLLAQIPSLASEAAAESFPRQDPALAKEIVDVAHRDLKGVRELVEGQPALARASIDWGFGDWEAAIDAASHVGRRDIAELLVAHGARPTIFSAAMMGQLEVVKGFVTAVPGVQRARGPHGITLQAHARAGGTDAALVLEYLKTLGDADTPLPSSPIVPADRDSVVGRYEFGGGPRDFFTVDVQNDRLGIDRPGSPARRLLIHTGNLVFFPTGVFSVKIAFFREAAVVTHLTVADGAAFVTAKRV
jgi:hypothetical protein